MLIALAESQSHSHSKLKKQRNFINCRIFVNYYYKKPKIVLNSDVNFVILVEYSNFRYFYITFTIARF